jgi:hypothetical protein
MTSRFGRNRTRKNLAHELGSFRLAARAAQAPLGRAKTVPERSRKKMENLCRSRQIVSAANPPQCGTAAPHPDPDRPDVRCGFLLGVIPLKGVFRRILVCPKVSHPLTVKAPCPGEQGDRQPHRDRRNRYRDDPGPEGGQQSASSAVPAIAMIQGSAGPSTPLPSWPPHGTADAGAPAAAPQCFPTAPPGTGRPRLRQARTPREHDLRGISEVVRYISHLAGEALIPTDVSSQWPIRTGG